LARRIFWLEFICVENGYKASTSSHVPWCRCWCWQSTSRRATT